MRTIYEIADEAGPITPGDIYVRYCNRVDDPRVERTMRGNLSNLYRYNLLEHPGSKRNRTYTVIE